MGFYYSKDGKLVTSTLDFPVVTVAVGNSKPRIAIIGAGACGIVACHKALQQGLHNVTVFEASSENWAGFGTILIKRIHSITL
jgi:cation diffusion facilitator CzcD-associated flavoprotein CzcO